MPTTQSRRPFLRQALKYFLRQTYSPKELIVVDDPGESIRDAIGPHPEIRYLQTDTLLPLGSKLNLGIGGRDAARGEIIQKLDDDDYYHPDFLSTTVQALCGAKREDSIVASTNHLLLIAATGELKVRNMDMRLFAGGTFCFFRDLWRKRPFRDVTLAEDKLFLQDHDAACIGLGNPELYCYVRHNLGNTWNRWEKSEQKEHGAVTAGEEIDVYFRQLPAYTKSLQEYIPEDDLWFYRHLAENGSSQSR